MKNNKNIKKREKRIYQKKSDNCLVAGFITSLLAPGPVGLLLVCASAAYAAADVYYNPEVYDGLMERTFKKEVRIEKNRGS